MPSRHLLSRCLPIPLLPVLLPAQAWVITDPAPVQLDHVLYDAPRGAAVGIDGYTSSTWSFAAGSWHRHVPNELEGQLFVTCAGFDAAHGRCLAVTMPPRSPARTYELHGAGWRLLATGSAPASGAAMAFD